MVLPLQKICLAAIRDSLKDRPNPYLQKIPPPNHRQNLRHDLLDLVLVSGIVRHESTYTSLSSPEFLEGLSSFSNQRGTTSDHEFLDRVADSLSVQRNGKTIGEGISELRLNIYTYWRSDCVNVALNLNSAVRVISQCPNLKSLHLDFIGDKLDWKRLEGENLLLAGCPAVDGLSHGGILNQVPALAPCLRGLENVEEFSLSASVHFGTPFYAGICSVLNFRCLSSLRLAGVSVGPEAWKKFLVSVQNSVIEFEASCVDMWDNYTNWIMPFPLPNLRSFKMEFAGPYTLQLIKNLMNCPKLEMVQMLFEASEEENAAMRLLSQMNVSVELEIYMDVGQNRDEYFDRDSNFKWVNLFKEKVKKVKFSISRWDADHSAALENLFVACPDLVEIYFYGYPRYGLQDNERQVAFNRLMTAVNSDLTPFLRDQSFVSKLRCLALEGPFDHAVLDALFENAITLETLELRHCPQLSDSHLQLWASCGGKPERLELQGCKNITDHGLVPILVSSGERMKYFRMDDDQLDRITKFTRRILFDHCPFLKPISLSTRTGWSFPG